MPEVHFEVDVDEAPDEQPVGFGDLARRQRVIARRRDQRDSHRVVRSEKSLSDDVVQLVADRPR